METNQRKRIGTGVKLWEFETSEDRDSTVVIWLVFILIVGSGWTFKDHVNNEAGFIIGTLLGYFGAIVQRFFKKGEASSSQNGNGEKTRS